MKIMIEASGSLVSGYIIKAIKEAGHVAVASDVDDFNHGACLADEFLVVPKSKDPQLWEKLEQILLENKIDAVIPSFDETLLIWAEKANYFAKKNINVLVSPPKTIDVFQDKWNTYNFFNSIDLPTVKSSLEQLYPVVKPRLGRGGSDIYIGDKKQDMTDMISQELAEGQEYTIDCLFDKNGEPIYIVPRKRIDVKDGKSTKGITVEHSVIENYIKHAAKNIKFVGSINFQAFESDSGDIKFIEVNPRIAGGMALGFAATENWINVLVNNIINGREITPKPIKYNLKMTRYYAECFIS